MGVNFLSYGFDYCINISYFFQTKRSHDVRSFCFCRHLCTVLSPATPHCSKGTRLLSVADKTIRRIVLALRYNEATAVADNISKSQVRAARTSQSPFCHSVTFPLSGESLFETPSLGNNNQTQLKALDDSRVF